MQRLSLATTLLLFILTASPCFADKNWIVRVETKNGPVQGKLMDWDASKFILLGRDGQLLEFDIKLAADSPRYNRPFQPYSHVQLKAQLEREFGNRYEVTGTGHYLVVHPSGQRTQWSDRFEELYREMTHYFSTRRISLRDPEFPLVAIVFHNRTEFEEYMNKNQVDTGFALAGFYAFRSNRIALFDITEGNKNVDWRLNAETIVHESAHQTAYNTGIHNRFTPPPQWLSEGLGTMFEARGVYAASKYRELTDRINQTQLAAFRKQFPEGISEEALAAIVSDDGVFRSNAEAAYAVSWAFTFAMAETQPSRLSEFLQRTADKPAFKTIGPDERLGDFKAVFGDNFRMVATRLNRYLDDLP
jgi:hypothetical protein